VGGLVRLLGHRLGRGSARGGKSRHMFTVYIIQSQTSERRYIGLTQDTGQRLRHHNSGANKSTKNKGPWILIHTETFKVKEEAYKRERQIKSYKGSEAFKKLISHGRVA